MAIRIVGVDLPQNKRGEIALTYIYGIGRSAANSILSKAGIDRDIKVKDWTDDQSAKVREIISTEYKVEGDLRTEIQLNIKRLMAKVPRITPVRVKVERKPLQIRKKLLNNK